MNTKSLNQRSSTKLAFVIICSGVLGSAIAQEQNVSSELFSSPFDACFENGYNIDQVTQDQAYATAKCFTALLETPQTKTSNLGASKHTILEYSVSWYSAAAEKGHKLSQTNLDTYTLALNQFDKNNHFSTRDQSQLLLASEKTFQALDTDNNGSLSLAEASSSPSLKNAFLQSDIDNDGLLNFGEYTILSGEATAAGNDQSQLKQNVLET